jgi:23S rRNA pseudouridine1911/1915/1917 synthase
LIKNFILTPLEILYEDNHLIAVNKTNHDLVQKDITGDKSLDEKLKIYIKQKYNKPGNVYLGVIHRLDRPVSGVVIFARTSKSLSRMNELFRKGTIKKKYWVIVSGNPSKKKDNLVHYLVKNTKQNKSYCHNWPVVQAKKAELAYSVFCSNREYSMLEIDLKTGRHHQIRAQLAAIGCPVKGDVKYGSPKPNDDGSISLHARQISFIHPVAKDPLTIVAEPPKEEVLWAQFVSRTKQRNSPEN